MKVHELLSDESKWTKKAFARASDYNTQVPVNDPSATCWCLQGAIYKCYETLNLFDEFELENVESKIIQKINTGIVEFNDSPKTTFEDVRKLCLELDI